MSDLRTFLLNAFDFLEFGFGLYRRGVCDKRIKNNYHLDETSEIHGYTKKEASTLLGLSERQFDRRIKNGELPAGKKVRNYTTLFWNKDLIDKMSRLK